MKREIIRLYNAINVKRPVLSEIIQKYANMTLYEFAQSFCDNKKTESIQSDEDFIHLCRKYISKLFNDEVAEKVGRRLEERKDILTSNHHCPNFCNIQINGEIIYLLAEPPNSIMPSFTFGDVPLNNPSYPRGIFLPGRVKIPIFPDSRKHSLVSALESFKSKDIFKAKNIVNRYYGERRITLEEKNTIIKILESCYLNKKVLSYSSYAEQSVIINKMLWKLIYGNYIGKSVADAAFLEIEKIAIELLKLDLNNKNSLFYNICFNTKIREILIYNLNGNYGCWDLIKLNGILYLNINIPDYHQNRMKLLAGAGTFLFWGIDSKQRRVPLTLLSSIKETELVGISDSGERLSIKFEPDSIIYGIENGKILPGLFTTFSLIAFARGYKCYGGFTQTDYLTNMKLGLIKTLNSCGFNDWAEKINYIKTNNFCVGPHFLLKRNLDNSIYFAGALDVITSGGFNFEQIEFIKTIRLENAYKLSLPSIYPSVYRLNERDEVLSKINIDNIISNIGKDKFLIL